MNYGTIFFTAFAIAICLGIGSAFGIIIYVIMAVGVISWIIAYNRLIQDEHLKDWFHKTKLKKEWGLKRG